MELTTFALQDAVDKLPVPPLAPVCEKFLVNIKALLSQADYEATEEAVRNFLSGNISEKLYSAVQDYNNSPGVDNYLDAIWLDGYLSYKGPLVVNVNPVFILEDDPTPSRNNQVARTSSLLLSSLKFIQALKTETLSPDMWKGNRALCMSQYRRLFGTCRIPTEEGKPDEMKTYTNTRHIVFLRRGKFYYFEGLDADNMVYLSERELAKNVAAIIHDADSDPDTDSKSIPLGVLTSEERPKWARARNELMAISVGNKQALEIIDSALFIVCLDADDSQSNGLSVSKILANALHGTTSTASRWYDKLQLIITPGGHAAVTFEHSVVDGHTILRFASDVFTDTIIRFAQTISGPKRVNSFMNASEHGSPNGTRLPSPGEQAKLRWNKQSGRAVRKIEFALSDQVCQSMLFAEAKLADLISKTGVAVIEFSGYGKSYIVQNGMSPDAFVQLAIITAYYQLYGSIVNTYEPVLTKSFKLGRTACARGATLEALAFAKEFHDLARHKVPKASRDTMAKVTALLHKALKRHSTLTREAAQGACADRLLYAMRCMQNHCKLDDPIFRSPGYKCLNESIISTSNCGNPSLRLFAFGAVCEQGYGVGYIIKDDSINFGVSSFRRQTARYAGQIIKYLEDIQDLLIELEPKDFEKNYRERLESNSSFLTPVEAERLSSNGGYDFYGETTANNEPGQASKEVSNRDKNGIAGTESGFVNSGNVSYMHYTLGKIIA